MTKMGKQRKRAKGRHLQQCGKSRRAFVTLSPNRQCLLYRRYYLLIHNLWPSSIDSSEIESAPRARAGWRCEKAPLSLSVSLSLSLTLTTSRSNWCLGFRARTEKMSERQSPAPTLKNTSVVRDKYFGNRKSPKNCFVRILERGVKPEPQRSVVRGKDYSHWKPYKKERSIVEKKVDVCQASRLYTRYLSRRNYLAFRNASVSFGSTY